MQDTAERRFFVGRHVGVPTRAVVSVRMAVRMNMHQFWVVMDVRCGRMNVQRAEPTPKLEVLLWRQFLISKKHQMLHPSMMNLVEGAVVEGS